MVLYYATCWCGLLISAGAFLHFCVFSWLATRPGAPGAVARDGRRFLVAAVVFFGMAAALMCLDVIPR
jgi:hypothetical protein